MNSDVGSTQSVLMITRKSIHALISSLEHYFSWNSQLKQQGLEVNNSPSNEMRIVRSSTIRPNPFTTALYQDFLWTCVLLLETSRTPCFDRT
ncbi:hypothetical protein CYFUS_001332 [Cystobacter fuscus]|uniref:Uncharacterized protein n=1 Tax=Cystobacter fuscus TaxID=43 RepID=A0A250IXF3_9BACT|nr:hypothetical protein CYFUS_001332 [Cystobacter fuscus]